jgi:hypothetical protein
VKYHTVTGQNAVMLEPETILECGTFLWIAQRFAGQKVTIQFDTTMLNGHPHMPMVWIKPDKVQEESA